MKWINGLTWQEKIKRKEEWHEWFAWYPVILAITAYGHKIKIWWKRIERKGTLHGGILEGTWWIWEYREIMDESSSNHRQSDS